MIIEPINLFIIGGVFIVLELMLTSFVLIFFGFGFIIVGIMSFFVKFSWEWQILTAFVFSIILMFALQKPFKKLFHKNSDDLKDNFLDESGIGEIRNSMVYYKGTFWKSDDIAGLEEGDKVEVLSVKDSKIKIKK